MNHSITSGRTSRRNMMRLDISVTDGAWWQRSGRGGVGGSSLLLYSRDKEFTTVTVYGWTQIFLKVTSDNQVCRPAHLREVQKRRVIYSHRYSLFMELTSMLTVFIISEAFLLSFILLFKEKKHLFLSSSFCIKQCTSNSKVLHCQLVARQAWADDNLFPQHLSTVFVESSDHLQQDAAHDYCTWAEARKGHL